MTLTAIKSAIACQALEEAIKAGVREFIVCPGKRNAPFIFVLAKEKQLKASYFYEERSAAFYALGRSRFTGQPVAIITTSGTAVGELLAATMEAYYTGVPLLLLTADRPRRYRGKNAPQSCEQVGIFGCYAPFAIDVADGEDVSLAGWDQRAPAHFNVCFEEPTAQDMELLPALEIPLSSYAKKELVPLTNEFKALEQFLACAKNLCVIVGALPDESRHSVTKFLQELKAPVYLEAISGIREEPTLQKWRVTNTSDFWGKTSRADYPIDSILRIGGVPTVRLWRDLENLQEQVAVFSVNEAPFSGLSWAGSLCTSLRAFFERFRPEGMNFSHAKEWLASDAARRKKAIELFHELPDAEPSLVYFLSQIIPVCSTVYLGNSLPIREWDLTAVDEDRGFAMYASRGLNGIDGQISAFLGVCNPEKSNWGIIGDLTALYDFSGGWAMQQGSQLNANLVVINNGGGKIFDRMFNRPEFQNPHTLSFESYAQFWGLNYELWRSVPMAPQTGTGNRLIEIVPDPAATNAFWDAYNQL